MNNKNHESDAYKKAIRQKLGEDKPITSERDNVIWKNLLAEIDTGKVVPLNKKRTQWYVIAAGIALLISLSIGAYLMNNNSHTKVLVDDNEIEESSEKNVENTPQFNLVDNKPSQDEVNRPNDTFEEKLISNRFEPLEVTTKNNPLLYTLSDSSLVTMNATTAIRTSKSFGAERKVSVLEGEAFFEVMPDKNRPFMVYFGEYKLEVVGTKFNVRNLTKEDFKEITVIEGAVRVFDQITKDGIELKKNEQLRIYANGESVVSTVNAENYISWKTRSLVFYQTPLEEVFGILSRQFSKKIELDLNIKNCRFTGDMSELTASEALISICLTSSLKVDTLKNKLYITGASCD